MSLLRKLFSYLVRGSSAYEYVAVAVLIVAIAIIITEVIARLFNTSIFILYEICGMALVIATFTAIASIFIKGRHLRIDIILTHVPDKPRQIIDLAEGILAIILTLVLTYLWWKWAYVMFEMRAKFETSLRPSWPFYIFVVIGWLALIIAEIDFVVKKLRLVRGSRDKVIEEALKK